MREDEWTPKRKSLCNQFWDDCAQEECEGPCEVIIKAEKLTYKDIKVFNKKELDKFRSSNETLRLENADLFKRLEVAGLD